MELLWSKLRRRTDGPHFRAARWGFACILAVATLMRIESRRVILSLGLVNYVLMA
jgi:hypothetical protein